MAFKKRARNHSRSSYSHSQHRDNNYKKKEEDFLAKIKKASDNPLPEAALEDLPQKIQDAYARAKWDTIMPVQSHAIPYLLEGRHMMIQSRTGSGKTGAYLLPLLDKLDPTQKQTQAIVLVPTRELAIQVEKEAFKLFGNLLSCVTLYGGVPYGRQLEALRRGVQVVIGTPGRMLDHLQKETLNFEHLKALVFDEADRMLSIGFYPDMKEIQAYLPENENMLITLFSATYPQNVLKLANEFLKEPELLSLSQGQVHIAEMQHYYVPCKRAEKERALLRLLETENPTSSIVFCNTKATVHYLTQVLKGFGYNAEELSSELSQSRREHVLMRLRKGDTRFLIATDVAARGIDVPNLSHVFLYEPPDDKESYIHKAGRTGRAGAQGTVISLVDNSEKNDLEKIAQFYSIELTHYPVPTEEEVAATVSAKVIALLEQQKRNLSGLDNERVLRYMTLAQELTSKENTSDTENMFLFAMLLDQVYQKALNPQAHEERRFTKYDRNSSGKPVKNKVFSQTDTLDSMRDAFQSEMREKYGSRYNRRERSGSSFGDRKFGRDRSKNRNDRKKDSPFFAHSPTNRNEDRENLSGFYGETFGNRKSRNHTDNNDDGVFQNNKSKYSGNFHDKNRNNSFSGQGDKQNDFYDYREQKKEFNPGKSFLPKKKYNSDTFFEQKQENFKRFHDEGYMTPVRSKKHRSDIGDNSNSFDRDQENAGQKKPFKRKK